MRELYKFGVAMVVLWIACMAILFIWAPQFSRESAEHSAKYPIMRPHK